MSEVIAGFIGAAAVLVFERLIVHRWSQAYTAKRIALAFHQELHAVEFSKEGEFPWFGGFSSQTFDTLFREAAETLPSNLLEDLMGYHWRMKFLNEMQQLAPDVKVGRPAAAPPGWIKNLKRTRESLVLELKKLKESGTLTLAVRNR